MIDEQKASRFPGTEGRTYLDTAAEGLPPASMVDALQEYARDKNLGTPGRVRLHEVERGVTASAARLLGAGVVLVLQRDPGALGEAGERLDEGDVLVVLDEAEDVAALVAAEAMEDLLRGVHVEARRLLLMERAERDEVGAGALERQVSADDIDDVARGADLFAEVVGEERQSRRADPGATG